jgi:hypothetical protein
VPAEAGKKAKAVLARQRVASALEQVRNVHAAGLASGDVPQLVDRDVEAALD